MSTADHADDAPEAPEEAGTAEAGAAYRSRLEDLKGLRSLDRYQYGNNDPEGVGPYEAVTWDSDHRQLRRRGQFIARDEATRFWEKVHTQPNGCWLWTSVIDSDGYGRFSVTVAPGQYRYVKAHRWAYEHEIGPIPAGYTVDHVRARGCQHRHCVRPDHLEAVTPEENKRRARQRRRHPDVGGDSGGGDREALRRIDPDAGRTEP